MKKIRFLDVIFQKNKNEKIIKLILEKEEIIFKNILKKKLWILHLL